MPTLPVGSPEPAGSDPWITGDSLAGDQRLNEVALPAAVTLDMCCESATDYLYQATGRRFRVLSETVYPNVASCGCWGLGSTEYLSDWSSIVTREVVLRSPVVADTVVVTIDGVVVDPSSYGLYDRERLVRHDGVPWPACPHLNTPVGGPTWSIAYSYGQPPPMNLILACRELAIHDALAMSGKPSKIPARAAGITRGGLSMQSVRGPNRANGRGGENRHLTGIPLVDDAITALNPSGLTGRGSVMSPDSIRTSSR